jgi:acyl transferase domain-containing protein/NADPH:quinone reductase-like Zn-dependent oxidoreductase/NADP-dependent 3-hydroxy acid dehydrogenase YdfG/acyl carrier protein/surfactin synthase thioesterase subunit
VCHTCWNSSRHVTVALVNTEALCGLIRGYVAERVGIAVDAVDPEERFRRIGLDSLGATEMIAKLGARLERSLAPTLAWHHPTPRALAMYLAGEASEPSDMVVPRRTEGREPIAVVGLSCRFPGAPNAEAYWRLLRDGVDAISEVPPERWSIDALYDRDAAAPGKMSTRWGGFLAAVDQFDAAFFGISPREAARMDPQQRLMLELSWEALENARIAPKGLRGSPTGVFFGAMWMEYGRLLAAPTSISQHTATGLDLSIISGRVSYSLGLRGPSLTVNTACSSSLVAVHLAKQSLLDGESRVALAGGVNLILSPESTITMSKFGAMAADGRSKAFDAGANGYVRGEGGGVVVLKRLSDALADGDRIYCVIRGSAVNNDGFSNGLTAPSPQAQQSVIRAACLDAGVAPDRVQYVEAHGTGTILGDPIEAGALGAALGVGRAPERRLRIGSVKTNIGHLEAAAGIAGLLKVVVSLQHGVLPPSLHYNEPSPHIPLQELGLRVQSKLESWTPEEGRRLAGVSSFGFSGTNAHVVVEALARPTTLYLAADSSESVRLKARGVVAALRARQIDVRALPRAAEGRHRLAVGGWSEEELASRLEEFLDGQRHPDVVASPATGVGAPKVALVFGGQGSQWVGMGRSLLQQEPVARELFARCDATMQSVLGFSVVDGLHTGDPELVERTDFIQPTIFLMQVALARVLLQRGLRVDAVVGQSMGEIAAACVAGAISAEDGARIVSVRSKLVTTLRGGCMAVVALSREATAEVVRSLGAEVSIAVAAGPASTVVAASPAAMTLLEAELARLGVTMRAVRVDYASHSPHVDPILPDLQRELSGIEARPCSIPLISTVTGSAVDGASLGADYWVRNLRAPVLFEPVIRQLATSGFDVFVEADPHPVLEQFIEQTVADAKCSAAVLACGARDESELSTLEECVRSLFVAGCEIPAVAEEEGGERWEAVVLSGKSEEAVNALAGRLREQLEEEEGLRARAVGYSLVKTRAQLEQRLVLVTKGREGLIEGLREAERGGTPRLSWRGGEEGIGKVCWLFTGQGSQRAGMGRGVYERWPAFRRAFDEVMGEIERHRTKSLREVMWSEPGTEGGRELSETVNTQPALFALEWAMAELWRSWGVEPDWVLGHSIGEVVAACVAGVFSLRDGVRLVMARGELMQRQPRGGAMVSVSASEEEVKEALSGYEGTVSVAAINGRSSVVISGVQGHVEEIRAGFAGRGVRTQALEVSHAFHSPMMGGMLEEFERVARSVEYRPAQRKMVSNVSGRVAGEEVSRAEYWVEQVMRAVRFGDCVTTLQGEGVESFVELGPRATLLGLLPETVSKRIASLQPPSEDKAVVSALGRFVAEGGEVDWDGVYPEGGRRVSLPTYPWQRQRYWVEASEQRGASSDVVSSSGESGHRLLGQRLSTAGQDVLYESLVSSGSPSWLGEHRIGGKVLVPAAAVAEWFRAAGEEYRGDVEVRVQGLTLQSPVVVSEGSRLRVQVVLSEGGRRASLYSQGEKSGEGVGAGEWSLHASAELTKWSGGDGEEQDVEALRERCPMEREVEEMYAALVAVGLEHGESFRGVKWLRTGEGEALAELSLPEGVETEGYAMHPALLDAALQASLAERIMGAGRAYLPFELGGWEVYERGARQAHAHVRWHEEGSGGSLVIDVTLIGAGGVPLARLEGFRARPVPEGVWNAVSVKGEEAWQREALHRIEWQRQEASERVAAMPGRWQLVDFTGGESEAVERELREQGVECEVVSLEDIARAGGEHVVCLWSGGEAGELAVRRAQEGLGVVRAVIGRAGAAPRLWWVTRGAVGVEGAEAVQAAGASLWGLGRSVMQEHPELRCTLVDVSGEVGVGRALLHELGGDEEERQVAWRGSGRYVARLVSAGAKVEAESENYELRCKGTGTLDGVVLEPSARSEPGPGEVEIEVAASGVNFRDVLNVLGMYPGEAPPLGSECAGVVTRVGSGVTGIGVGSRVMALGAGTFRRYAIVDGRRVVGVPTELTMVQAATVPAVFATAWYALHDLAELKAGQRILIHAAAGGVGMAAVQIARWIGAEVLATASEPKWASVRALGVEHVASSRDLSYVEAFGVYRGKVDVVLNALAGEHVDASASLLSKAGRFIEMGKTDLRDADSFPVSYRAFDLMEVEAGRIGEILREVKRGLEGGQLEALPVRTYGVDGAQAALRWMAQARHVGKLALLPAGRGLRQPGTVLVTGGLGGLGLQIARQLAEQGVEHLVLLGRQESRRGEEVEQARAELEAKGSRVSVGWLDVSDRGALEEVLRGIPEELPLRGVIHAAGVLDDGVLKEQTAERYAGVMSGKVLGAWNLHELTQGAELEVFVLFSSTAGAFGAAGQSGYAAANAYLDGLAQARRARGLPATSLGWGPWESVGMASALSAGLKARLARQGYRMLSRQQGRQLFAQALKRDEAHLVVCRLELQELRRSLPERLPGFWQQVMQRSGGAVGGAVGNEASWSTRVMALPERERAGALGEIVRATVARVLSLPDAALVPLHKPLEELGLDSLMAVELRNALARDTPYSLPAMLAFEYPTASAISAHLLSRLVDEHEEVDDGALQTPQKPSAEHDGRAPSGADTIELVTHAEVLNPLREPSARLICFHEPGSDSTSLAHFMRLSGAGIEVHAWTQAPPVRPSAELARAHVESAQAYVRSHAGLPLAVLGVGLGASFAATVLQRLMEQPGCDVKNFFACGPLPLGVDPALPVLTLPIVIFAGRQDSVVNETLIESWGKLTSAELSFNLLPGDRSCFSQRGNQRLVVDDIARRLAGELRSGPSNGRAGRQRSTVSAVGATKSV